MRSPIVALAWQIWRQNRRSIWLVVGIVSFCSLANQIVPEGMRLVESYRKLLNTLNGMLMGLSLLFVFGIFNFTETRPGKEWTGFPYRLFVLPVSTLRLVALPICLGVASIVVAYFLWAKLVLTHAELSTTWWLPMVLGAFMVVYQTVLWSLAGFRIIRIVVLGLLGPIFVFIGVLPFAAKDAIGAFWISEEFLSTILVGIAVAAFLTAWASVARQRGEGGRRRNRLNVKWDRIMDALPRRRKAFTSPAAAQFWFEWRRAGWVLPMCAGGILILVGPISWSSRNDPNATMETLTLILAMPLVLAGVVGMSFSKADFWSRDHSLNAFLAVRPLATGDIVVTKMKVAALSVAITWSLVLAFVFLWLGSWPNTSQLEMFLFMFKTLYPHSWHLILVLSVVGLSFITWRNMVGELWIGLAGSWKPLIISFCLKGIALALALGAFAWVAAHDKWFKAHADLQILIIGWALALAVFFKLWIAVFSWSKVTTSRVWKYLLIWSGSTATLVALAILASPGFDVYRTEHLFVLIAFLLFPIARLGLAPLSLARNRHR